MNNALTKYRKAIWVVAIAQMLLLCFIAGKREWIRQQGDTVYIRTAPVDPRDIFRGDYVQLEYDIAFPSNAIVNQFLQVNPEINQEKPSKRQPHSVYLGLNLSGGVAEPQALLINKPDQGLFIKGRLKSGRWRRGQSAGLIQFGIEKYFIEQGTGLALEETRGKRNDWQTAMEMEVALGADGTAVIKGHRWADVGVRIEVIERPENPNRRNQQNTQENDGNNEVAIRRSPSIRVSLRNQSEKMISLLVSGDQFCEFQLIKNSTNNRSRLISGYEVMELTNRDCANINVSSFKVKSLAPNETHVMVVDFSKAQWHLTQNGKNIEIADLSNNWQGFRWVYQPPHKNNSGIENLWQSSIKTAVFRANGNVD